MVELLLENGANCNIHDKHERRPIHWASFMGYNEIIKLLVKFGSDVNCMDKEVKERAKIPSVEPRYKVLLRAKDLR